MECLISFLFFVLSISLDASAELEKSTSSSIETLRKRDCTITVNDTKNSPVGGVSISVKQVRHHFGFGAAIPLSILHDEKLQKVFLDHFEWAAFENEMKWPQTDTSSGGPDYSRADSLLDFCRKNDIKVRAHNLFWNEGMVNIPLWTQNLNTKDFKKAVDDRITNAITHFKGKVEQWDVANEVIHGNVLETKTGNSNIWNDIFKKCRQLDPAVKLAINDYNIIEKYSDVMDKYIAKINSISDIDIIGLEGHFGVDLVQSDYKPKLEKMAGIGKPIWLTEVDFEVSDPATGVKTLLETIFANPKVEGIIMWVFWQGNLWRDSLKSYIANKDYSINNTGKQWETTLNGWTTKASGTTDESGKYSFKGFHGKYKVTSAFQGHSQIDTVYLEPGSGAKTLTITEKPPIYAESKTIVMSNALVRINGKLITIKRPTLESGPLFISTYTLSGRLLLRQPITIRNGCGVYQSSADGCCIYSIKTGAGADIAFVGFPLRR